MKWSGLVWTQQWRQKKQHWQGKKQSDKRKSKEKRKTCQIKKGMYIAQHIPCKSFKVTMISNFQNKHECISVKYYKKEK